MSDYEKCQRNGWGPGAVLVGDEGYGPTVIQITYLSPQTLLAKTISHNGVVEAYPRERSWTLAYRDWAVVA